MPARKPSSIAAQHRWLRPSWLALLLVTRFPDIGQDPGFIEVRLGGRVEAEIGKPGLAGYGRDPVGLLARWRIRANEDVDRAIRVLGEVHARRAIRDLLLVGDQGAG